MHVIVRALLLPWIVTFAAAAGPQPVAPFFVYNDTRWMKMTCNGASITHFLERHFKHTDDYWFLKHALHHPSRTLDPARASVFVVGALLNILDAQHVVYHQRCCVDSVCGRELVRRTERRLKKSEWFRRREGADHVVVASHWSTLHWKSLSLKKSPHIASCNRITFQSNNVKHGRLHLGKTYVGRRCARQNKTHDVAFVATMKKKFPWRRQACEWLRNVTDLSVRHCGSGDQCPALAEARVGLHIRGDSFGSNRLLDTLLSGTVPVMTNEAQYKILPPFLPWRNMSLFASMHSKEAFLSSLRAQMLYRSDEVARFNEDSRVAERVDWEKPFLFEEYMRAFTRFILQQQVDWTTSSSDCEVNTKKKCKKNKACLWERRECIEKPRS